MLQDPRSLKNTPIWSSPQKFWHKWPGRLPGDFYCEAFESLWTSLFLFLSKKSEKNNANTSDLSMMSFQSKSYKGRNRCTENSGGLMEMSVSSPSPSFLPLQVHCKWAHRIKHLDSLARTYFHLSTHLEVIKLQRIQMSAKYPALIVTYHFLYLMIWMPRMWLDVWITLL